MRRNALLGACAALWFGGIGVGLERLWAFESTPGVAAIAPPEWPVGSHIPRGQGRASLVMLVHPQCSCTAASMQELQAIMSAASGRVSAWVLFVQPAGRGSDWKNTASWQAARRIEGVTALVDSTGSEAARFGARTSGQVVLYDAAGHLLYAGGITAARGHAGDNMGRHRVLALLDRRTTDRPDGAVYGCSLFDLPAGSARARAQVL